MINSIASSVNLIYCNLAKKVCFLAVLLQINKTSTSFTTYNNRWLSTGIRLFYGTNPQNYPEPLFINTFLSGLCYRCFFPAMFS